MLVDNEDRAAEALQSVAVALAEIHRVLVLVMLLITFLIGVEMVLVLTVARRCHSCDAEAQSAERRTGPRG